MKRRPALSVIVGGRRLLITRLELVASTIKIATGAIQKKDYNHAIQILEDVNAMLVRMINEIRKD